MRHKYYLLLILVHCCFAQNADGQNLYIEVLDASSYRPISNVKVFMESENTQMTFITSPRGEIFEYIPSGQYSISFSRDGFQLLENKNIVVYPNERTTKTFMLQPLATLSKETKDTLLDIEIKERIIKKRVFFTDIGYQWGNIKAVRGAIGYYMLEDLYMQLMYSHSWADYQSVLFANPEISYDVKFNNLWLALGYEYVYPLNDDLKIVGGPEHFLGIESARNKNLINNDAIGHVLIMGYKPGFRIGVNYLNYAVQFGFDYTFWLFNTVNEKMYPLKNGTNGKFIKWGQDLFPNRKGFNITAGIRVYF